MEFNHIPVMAKEAIEALNIRPDGVYVDGTLGGAGHSSLICEKLKDGHLIGIDRDKNALQAAGERLKSFPNKITLINDNFNQITSILGVLDMDHIDGALLDLGVSSYQLDEPSRGFSYRFDAPLDMRMDEDANLSAADVVNTYSEQELTRIIFEYGEDKNARKIARRIIENRPIDTTLKLVDVIKSAFSPKERYEGKHPAKRTFQAIRIEVNNELSVLDKAVEDFANALNPSGRLAIITFHSLEDRIVKNTFQKLSAGCTCPKDFPVCVCGNVSKFKVVTKKPILPGEQELDQNPRAASAKLRVLEKLPL